MGWLAPRPRRFTPERDPIPIVQEVGWAPGPVWTAAENLAPTRIRSPDRPARSESLYRLRYPGPQLLVVKPQKLNINLFETLCLSFSVQHFTLSNAPRTLPVHVSLTPRSGHQLAAPNCPLVGFRQPALKLEYLNLKIKPMPSFETSRSVYSKVQRNILEDLGHLIYILLQRT
jgi:hypothetical protein